MTRITPRSSQPPNAAAITRYGMPSAPNATGSSVSGSRMSVYQSMFRIVSRSPQTSGAMGTRALP